jgi:hypothetical protein
MHQSRRTSSETTPVVSALQSSGASRDAQRSFYEVDWRKAADLRMRAPWVRQYKLCVNLDVRVRVRAALLAVWFKTHGCVAGAEADLQC